MLGPHPYNQIPPKTHLSENELGIWKRCIEKFPALFDIVSYDVELGTPRGFDADRPEPYARHHAYLGGYKIDVVGDKEGQKTIVEIKHQATTKAIGEVDLYEFLYIITNESALPPKLMILTDEEMPHMREWCAKWAVELLVV